MLLANMRERASEYLQNPINDAVITVPVHFDQNQIQATIRAAQSAGLDVMQIVNEPIAAAIAYGLDELYEKTNRNILVFDLGGSTLDVSLLDMNDGYFTVKGNGGDLHLGGEDFDDEILSYALDNFKQ